MAEEKEKPLFAHRLKNTLPIVRGVQWASGKLVSLLLPMFLYSTQNFNPLLTINVTIHTVYCCIVGRSAASLRKPGISFVRVEVILKIGRKIGKVYG